MTTVAEAERKRVDAWLKEGNNPTTKINMGQCALCYKKMTSHEAFPTCSSVWICETCEGEFKRKTMPMPISENVGRFCRVYKKFLQGKAYPQIQCKHVAGDGSVAIDRLEDNTKWFD